MLVKLARPTYEGSKLDKWILQCDRLESCRLGPHSWNLKVNSLVSHLDFLTQHILTSSTSAVEVSNP
jgi:hypothetical protein